VSLLLPRWSSFILQRRDAISAATEFMVSADLGTVDKAFSVVAQFMGGTVRKGIEESCWSHAKCLDAIYSANR
jgi:hypothetical protein